MTTASPTTNDERIEFTTAAEYYEGRDEPDREAPHLAKTIVWYDQTTPIFCCEHCHEHVAPVEHQGDGRADDYEQRRYDAFRALFEDDPQCDVCTGDLPQIVTAENGGNSDT